MDFTSNAGLAFALVSTEMRLVASAMILALQDRPRARLSSTNLSGLASCQSAYHPIEFAVDLVRYGGSHEWSPCGLSSRNIAFRLALRVDAVPT